MSIVFELMHSNTNSHLQKSTLNNGSAITVGNYNENNESAESKFTPGSDSANSATVSTVNTVNEEFVIVKATPTDFEDILEFMLRDFLHTEPLNQALNVGPDDAAYFFAEIIRNNLTDNLSYLAREKRSDRNLGRVVAIRLSSILTRPSVSTITKYGGAATVKVSEFSDAKICLDKIRKIELFLETIESKTWKILPARFQRLMSVAILSVDSAWTRRGIARRLVTHNLDEARRAGCQGIVTEATAFNSQQLFAKCGYRRLYEIAHAEWCDENGAQIFRCADRTNSATLEFLEL